MEDKNEVKQNPFFGIWLHPRASIRQAIDKNLYIPAFIFVTCASIGQMLDIMARESIGDTVGIAGIFFIALFGGVVGGAVSLCLMSWLLKHVGRWLGGVGDFNQLIIAIGWANVPAVWVFLLKLSIIAMFGRSLFTSDGPVGFSLGHYMAATLVVVAIIVITVWGIFVFCKAVGEAHGFSTWRGFGSILITSAFFVFLLYFITGLIIV